LTDLLWPQTITTLEENERNILKGAVPDGGIIRSFFPDKEYAGRSSRKPRPNHILRENRPDNQWFGGNITVMIYDDTLRLGASAPLRFHRALGQRQDAEAPRRKDTEMALELSDQVGRRCQLLREQAGNIWKQGNVIA
jgi:hypothetical protein